MQMADIYEVRMGMRVQMQSWDSGANVGIQMQIMSVGIEMQIIGRMNVEIQMRIHNRTPRPQSSTITTAHTRIHIFGTYIQTRQMHIEI